MTRLDSFDEPDKSSEASVAKRRLSEPLTKKDRNNIRRLYSDGYTLPRIRQMLGLRATLTRLRKVADDRR
jgi:hypothetical protein